MTEIDFDRLMDATQTVIQLLPGTVLTAEMIAEIQYAFDCERQHEDDAVDAHHKGYLMGLERGAGADKAALIQQVEDLRMKLSVANALNKYWQAAPVTDEQVVTQPEGRSAQ